MSKSGSLLVSIVLRDSFTRVSRSIFFLTNFDRFFYPNNDFNFDTNIKDFIDFVCVFFFQFVCIFSENVTRTTLQLGVTKFLME